MLGTLLLARGRAVATYLDVVTLRQIACEFECAGGLAQPYPNSVAWADPLRKVSDPAARFQHYIGA